MLRIYCKKPKAFWFALINLAVMLLYSKQAVTQVPDLKLTYLTREQGLSSSAILSMLQDSRGYMWFGSGDGLNKYDGYRITVYKNDPKSALSISNNNITRTFEDSQHRLWVATSYGLNLYNRVLDNFTSFMYSRNNSGSINNNFVLSIYEDTHHRVWIGTNAGLNLFNDKTQTFESFIDHDKLNDGNKGVAVNAIIGAGQNSLWLGTAGAGIRQFNTISKTFSAVNQTDDKLNLLSSINISTIKTDLQDNLWIGTAGNGVFVYNHSDQTLTNYTQQQTSTKSISGNVIEDILCDHKGNIWISPENGGLDLWQPASKSFFRYEDNPQTPYSFPQKTATALVEDNQDNIWIATLKGGVYLYATNAYKFKTYTQGNWPGALSYRDVKCFFEEKNGNIWVGTDGGGINIWNRKTNLFKQYKNEPGNQNSISSDAILNITQDNKGTIWVGTWGGGLNKFNSATGTFTRYLQNKYDESETKLENVWQIFQDSKGVLWIATYHQGLNIFDPQTEKFTRIKTLPNGNGQFLGDNVLNICEDDQHRLWVATLDGGLNCFSADRKKIDHYLVKNKESVENVRCLFIDNKKRLWAGTVGLCLFDEKAKAFRLYCDDPQLRDERIQSIIQDNHNNLWLGTNNGLFRFNPETRQLKRFTNADGLQGLEFSPNACIKTKTGELVFGGHLGFNIFHPDSIETSNYHYPVYITDLLIFNKSVKPGAPNSPIDKNISETDHISLSYSQSVFSFEFAALNYVTPTKTQFAYQLSPFDKNWNYVGTQRRATYTNLDPGDYIFTVKANAPDGNWNTQTRSIKITVMPPFWLTWWFKLITAIAVTITIFLILYYRRRAELRTFNEQKREEIHQMQLQFFTNISHEFRTPLTLILGTLEQILKKDAGSLFTRHYHTINRNANRLMHLISELMDFRKSEAGSLKLKVMPGNFSQFIVEIAREFEEQALTHHIKFSLKQDNQFNNVWFDRQVIEKILLNLINNAFKYTPDNGIITMEVLPSIDNYLQSYTGAIKIENDFKAHQYLYISITDNGIGIAKEAIDHLFERYYRVSDHHLGSGIGLAFVKSLTFLHKGSIHVYSEYEKGTQIIVAIPCSQQDYSSDQIWPFNFKEGGVQLESIQYKEAAYQTEPQQRTLQPSVKRGTTKQCILMVDDNAELRAYFKEILSPLYQVIEADNGASGIEKAKAESPALIISDVMMPVMDGIEFCAHIKDDFETSHIPFILLTAKDALESRLEGAESGADYYFSKPVSTDLLLLTIRNLFNQKEKIKERYLKDYQVEVRDLVHSGKDKTFMDQLLKIIESRLEDAELNVDFVCREIGVSKTKLYKKIKDITGQSINEFIRTIRLKKSIEIMTHEDVLITEVMYRVGILSQSYFTTIFKKEFGMTPSQFQQQLDQKKAPAPKK